MSDICGERPAPEKGLASTTVIPVPPQRVWQALTSAAELCEWWAEGARVDLPRGVFELQGPNVPDAPAASVTQLVAYEAGSRLSFTWQMYGALTAVDLHLAPVAAGTQVTARHTGMRHSDLWIVALENLRLHCLGRAVQRYPFRPVHEVHVGLEIAAPPEQVFEALLDPAVLDSFWATGARIDPHVGGKFDYGWGGGPLKVLDLVPGERLSVSWEEGADNPETIVTWQLSGSGGGTRITLTHTGFTSGREVDDLDIGWFGFLLELRALLELGPGWDRITPQSYVVETADGPAAPAPAG